MSYTIGNIAAILQGKARLTDPGATIEHLLIDSRRLVFSTTSLFFALHGSRNEGSYYIGDLISRGVFNFVVPAGVDVEAWPSVNFIIVDDVRNALQTLASVHRQKFDFPIVGITGSNGKTIVKEWLYQLLQPDLNIVRNPRSYNSQTGVPLSIWQMDEVHQLGIFEAGISRPGEMSRLEDMIRPTIGILTNIGEAHKEGFANDLQKAREKAILFAGVKQLVYCKDALTPGFNPEHLQSARRDQDISFFSWSRRSEASLFVVNKTTTNTATTINGVYAGIPVSVTIPFTDRVSIDNAITCWCVLIILGYNQELISERMRHLIAVDMRMQLKAAIHGCLLINDSYSNDLLSFALALDYLRQQSVGKNSTVILSDILESGLSPAHLVKLVLDKVEAAGINRLILIGPGFYGIRAGLEVAEGRPSTGCQVHCYESTDAFLQAVHTSLFRDEVILLKGARVFEFERIGHLLEAQTHQTILEVNLSAMVHNLKAYQRILHPHTKVMAMVKAFSYGSGSVEIARLLQYQKVDYLAVAYADEGITLRKDGVSLPIMVMNPEEVTFDALVEYNLEPELYSFSILRAFDEYLNRAGLAGFPIHLKIDTGMHRLGFETFDVPLLTDILVANHRLVVRSVFSHLVGSDNPLHDAFSLRQASDFEAACGSIESLIGYTFIKHLSNTGAIFRHPHLQYDMVRLGIGLYGVPAPGVNLPLQPAVSLRTTVAQVRKVQVGETVGYSRAGLLHRDSIIATVRIGYADGFSRKLGNGVGSMLVRGALAPVIGNVCMDMTMLDVTNIDGVREDDYVEVFGTNLPVTRIAEWCETIPYEIMTGISQRVKRVYFEE
ncbi:bifunctional UDP-N-acetylmuramoyl-tripeptide:D-alanyl-D-alanine ligase/alanine racemase [Segetibacter sp. 3557_3]|uniref:bifunctional UDP-N-acetylmuramoyl-tripeptide:D-alanyl-D-alanine ligase/alanine racemase n=1 Tax=Segetibacter sp. 3557_3 TaxID=2547429 RepID=UPI0010585889|nr:bifunctional UDP-N-acetylmuramoyl-tripeptide:D-alanyl-D-alanine ligase/alanine racemase [Segetibacter sp. 3557_3]TDH26084.1 bifunctional UDP-N-acetylmuramoyl-tripeptide:D-alanyl-D-alanine ligase/alanine racemase [Segetibacter sp. 3557_3]